MEAFGVIIGVILSFAILILLVCIVVGIALLITAAHEKDVASKAKYKKAAKWCVLIPFLLIVVVVVVWGVVSVGSAALK